MNMGLWYDMIYLLTAIGLSPGGSSTVHIYTQTIHRTIQNKQYIEQHNNWKSAGRAPSWLVIPWHLPYNRGKSMEKPQSGFAMIPWLWDKPTLQGLHTTEHHMPSKNADKNVCCEQNLKPWSHCPCCPVLLVLRFLGPVPSLTTDLTAFPICWCFCFSLACLGSHPPSLPSVLWYVHVICQHIFINW